MRRQALEEELQRAAPPCDPKVDGASAVLEDFARFWELETDPAERRKLLLSLFAQVWAKDRAIVAIKPHAAFMRYFKAVSDARSNHTNSTGNAGVTITGATGLEPATSAVTGQRSNQLSYAPRCLGRWRPYHARTRSSMPSAPR
jgi:hypothetical protein